MEGYKYHLATITDSIDQTIYVILREDDMFHLIRVSHQLDSLIWHVPPSSHKEGYSDSPFLKEDKEISWGPMNVTREEIEAYLRLQFLLQ